VVIIHNYARFYQLDSHRVGHDLRQIFALSFEIC